jgi:drug/metabolite transporter (DMT)-like permease
MSNVSASIPTSARSPVRSRPAMVYAGLWFVVMAWGGSFVAARLLLHAEAHGEVTLSPTVLAAARFSLASIFFVVPLARAIRRRQISMRDLAHLALLGQITYGLYFWLQYTGVQLTNASISSILVVGLIPVVTAFLSQFIGGERLSRWKFAALLLGFAGVAVIVSRQSVQFTRRPGFLFGALCLVGDAFAFAVYARADRRHDALRSAWAGAALAHGPGP